MAAAEAELARVQLLNQTLQQVREFLERAQDRVHRDIAPRLAASVRRWLPEVTVNRYQDIRVDPQSLNVQVSTQAGQWRTATLLSHGTAEQVYLLLRLALAEHLVKPKPGEKCPLLLGDVTAHCDSERTEVILRTLHAISQEHQVILFSKDDKVLAWAKANLHPPTDRLEQLQPSVP